MVEGVKWEMACRDEITKRAVKKRTATGLRLLAITLILFVMSTLALLSWGPGRLYSHDVSVRQLYENPSAYTGQKVSATGYLIKHTAPHFGDTYNLCEGDPRNLYFAVNPCIAVEGASSTLDRYISFTYNGTSYEVALSPCSFAAPCRVIVSGVFIDRGPVTDASQYAIEVSSVTWFPE